MRASRLLTFALMILVCSSLGLAQERPLILNDFQDPDISDWQGGVLVGEGLSIQTQAVKTVFQDWSGYRVLNLRWDQETTVWVRLTDADGEVWTMEGHGQEMALPFAEFTLTSPREDGRISLGTIQSLELKLSQPASLDALFLTGSNGFDGPTAYISVTFDYYKSKSWLNIGKEIHSQGFTGVHLTTGGLTPATYDLQHDIVSSLQAAGLKVALTIYPGTDFWAYQRYPQWRQEFLNGGSAHDWRVYLCLGKEEYIQYTEQFVQNHILTYGYDALQMSEPWLEVWGGPERPDLYACFCDHCIEEFRALTGVNARDLFTNPRSELYYRNNDALYQQWLDFRVDIVMNFVERITKAVRAVSEAKVFTMYLSDITVDPGKTREYHGMDMNRMAAIAPDGIIIETAWQDWLRPELPPSYAITYGREYVNWVYGLDPGIKVYSQPDVGSQWERMHRGPGWLRQFASNSYRSGFDGYVVYEYGQMGYRMIPHPVLLLDDFSKNENTSLYSAKFKAGDEVIVGRVGRDAYQGEGALMVLFNRFFENEYPITIERKVRMNLSSHQGIEFYLDWGNGFWEDDQFTLALELVTEKEVLRSEIQATVTPGWNQIRIPFAPGDLTQVQSLRIILEYNENLPVSGTVRLDMVGVYTTRLYAIEQAHLPERHSTRLAPFRGEIESLRVESQVLQEMGEMRRVSFQIEIENGDRSIMSHGMDLVLEAQGIEQGKWSTRIPITRLPREEKGVYSGEIVMPPGEYQLKVFIFPVAGSPFNPEERYLQVLPITIP